MIKIIELLVEVLDSNRVWTGDKLQESYYHIWEMESSFEAKAIVFPKSTEEISNICQICYEHNQSILVFGGRTNLVGSTETVGDEIIISMEKLNTIHEIDVQSRTVTVDAGVILEEVHQFVAPHDLLFPLNFGAKGSAQIGGIIANNAGGLRVLKYGMTRSLILGLEYVLMDGTIVSSLKKIVKDNSGYDLKQLLIGSEGTLGIVSKAVLKLEEKPKSRQSAFIGFNEFKNVIHFLKYIDKELSGSLTGFELLLQNSYQTICSPTSLWKAPLRPDYQYYVLVESLGSHHIKDQEKFQLILEKAMENDLFLDAVIADGESDLTLFWNIREDVSLLHHAGPFAQHFDISVPISNMEKYINNTVAAIENIEEVLHCFTFGHVADGNIHFIVSKENDSNELKELINQKVYQPLQSFQGSVSAEHGIGKHKKPYLALCRSQSEIALMKKIKDALDPKGLLNPNKIL